MCVKKPCKYKGKNIEPCTNLNRDKIGLYNRNWKLLF